MSFVELLLHALSLAHGIGASLLFAACFFLAGSLLIPRRWDASLGTGESPAIVGAAVYVLLCWFGVELGVPVKYIALGFTAMAALAVAARCRWVVAALRARSVFARGSAIWLIGFCLFYALAYVFTLPPVTEEYLPIKWTGNIDLLTYIRYTRYLWELRESNLVGFGYINFVYFQTPAVFYLMGWFSALFGMDPLSAAIPAQFALSALIGLLAARISREVFRLPRASALIVGGVLVSGPFFRYVASAYFLSTLVSLPVLLLLLWTTIVRRPSRLFDPPLAVRFAAAYVLLLFIYPFLLFAGLGVQLAAIGLTAVAELQSGKGIRSAASSAVRTLCAAALPLAVLVACLYSRFAWSLDMVRSLSSAGVAGWPLELIAPRAMFALPAVRADHVQCPTCTGVEAGAGAGQSLAIVTFLGLAVVLAGLYFWWCRRRTTPEQRTLTGLAAGTLVVYCAYFFALGPSYQQWKFASYSVLPFSFVVVAVVLHLMELRAGARAAGRLAWALAVCLIGGNLAVHAESDPPMMRFSGAFRNIEQVDRLPSFREITIKMGEQPAAFPTWLALYYLPSKRVHVVSSIFFPNEPLSYEEVSSSRPLLIHDYSCEGVGPEDTMTIPGVGCLLFAPPGPRLDTSYPFNRSFLFVEFDVMTARETGGRWNVRDTLALKLTADPQKLPVGQALYVNLLIHPFLPEGVKPQRLVFAWGAGRRGEIEIADRDWISLPVETTDWGGEWVRTLPISIAFPDGRTLLFQELSIGLAPGGRVVGD